MQGRRVTRSAANHPVSLSDGYLTTPDLTKVWTDRSARAIVKAGSSGYRCGKAFPRSAMWCKAAGEAAAHDG